MIDTPNALLQIILASHRLIDHSGNGLFENRPLRVIIFIFFINLGTSFSGSDFERKNSLTR